MKIELLSLFLLFQFILYSSGEASWPMPHHDPFLSNQLPTLLEEENINWSPSLRSVFKADKDIVVGSRSVIYYSADSTLSCKNFSTEQILWSIDQKVSAGPVLDDKNHLLYVVYGNTILGIDSRSGFHLWRHNIPTDHIPLIDEESRTFFVASKYSNENKVSVQGYALNALREASVIWESNVTISSSNDDDDDEEDERDDDDDEYAVLMPVFSKDKASIVLVISSDSHTVIVAIDKATGHETFHYRLNVSEVEVTGIHPSSGKLYLARDGDTLVFDMESRTSVEMKGKKVLALLRNDEKLDSIIVHDEVNELLMWQYNNKIKWAIDVEPFGLIAGASVRGLTSLYLSSQTSIHETQLSSINMPNGYVLWKMKHPIRDGSESIQISAPLLTSNPTDLFLPVENKIAQITCCSGNGECLPNGKCDCDFGFQQEEDCSIFCPTSCPLEKGRCNLNNTCECHSTYFPRGLCTHRCQNGQIDEDGRLCLCFQSYYGASCDIFCHNDKTCSGNGYCSSDGKKCICNEDYSDSDCSSYRKGHKFFLLVATSVTIGTAILLMAIMVIMLVVQKDKFGKGAKHVKLENEEE